MDYDKIEEFQKKQFYLEFNQEIIPLCIDGKSVHDGVETGKSYVIYEQVYVENCCSKCGLFYTNCYIFDKTNVEDIRPIDVPSDDFSLHNVYQYVSPGYMEAIINSDKAKKESLQ